jgi:quercetin dioxygenase-like cupin family protein
MDMVNRERVELFVTKDGSTIREILAPRNSVIARQSLAEATVAPGCSTQAHYHPVTEEIYYILAGSGEVRIEGEGREALAAECERLYIDKY